MYALETSDIPIIVEVLEDYQWWMDNFPGFYFDTTVLGSFRVVSEVRRFQSRRATVEHVAPLVIQALVGKVPQGFNFLKTVDGLWYAWRVPGGLIGPTTQFQARLWCMKQSALTETVELAKEVREQVPYEW